MSTRDGSVFVGEDFDDDFDIWPGTFSAHWESVDGDAFEDGPQGVSVDEAIGWGRGRADVVLVRPGDEDVHYSAGAVNPSDAEEAYLDWPEGRAVERRRRAGMEHLDVAAAEPLTWAVRLPRNVLAEQFDAHAHAVSDALAAHEAVSDVTVEAGDGPGDAIFRFTVPARDHAAALRIVLAAQRDADGAAPAAFEGRPLGPGPHYLPTGWDPHDDIRPAAG